jgi:peptidoglycan/xylan/chitin deacetylase (PgdA/CDA1 family)
MTALMSSAIVTCVSYHHFETTASLFTRSLGVSTSPDAFAAHLAYFKRYYTPISLDQLLAGDLPPNPLLLTIDDCYRSVLEIAAPLLARNKIPALLSTNPKVITGGFAPIDNVLSFALQELGATGLGIAVGLKDPWSCTVRRIVRELLPYLDTDGREEIKRKLMRLLGVREADLVDHMDLFLNPGQLQALVREHGFSLGNHTVSHSHLRALKPAAARFEIEDGKRQLEAMTGAKVRAFTFPYGSQLDATAEVLGLLRDSRHEAIFLVKRRTNAVRPAADIWYRQSMAEDLVAQLPVKLTLLPRMGELKAALN